LVGKVRSFFRLAELGLETRADGTSVGVASIAATLRTDGKVHRRVTAEPRARASPRCAACSPNACTRSTGGLPLERSSDGEPAPELESGPGRCMVTDMVQRRKLTADLVANFPALDAEACIARKGDIGNSVRFRAFFRVQNRTESDRNLTKERKIVQERTKRRQKSAFFATGFIKTCQVNGPCQSIIGASSEGSFQLTAEALTNAGTGAQGGRWPQPKERLQHGVHGVPLRCTEFSLSENSVWRVLSQERYPRRSFSVALWDS